MDSIRERLLSDALSKMHPTFDPAQNMVKVPFRSRGYHTRIENGIVHPNRDSIVYAVACLDSGEPALVDRAEAVIRTVISHQDQAPESETYGIWSYHQEEPLEEMAPPDWNWADFIGKELLNVVIHHGDRISANCRSLVDEAIRHAAASIRRRDMGPHYTNIAIMGTYVTHLYAEIYGDDEMLRYARQRLAGFVKHTKQNGVFTEYNSPTYTLLAMTDISRMLANWRTEESLELARWLHDFVWHTMASHFHAPTRQWAGPHTRSYDNFLLPKHYTVIHLATNGEVSLIDESEMELASDLITVPFRCPADVVPLFAEVRETTVEEVVTRFTARRDEMSASAGDNRVVNCATTYLGPAVSVGTFSLSHYWNQSRPIVGYWNEPAGTCCLTVQFLHDGYDFSSALSATVQDGPVVAAAAYLATDNGDTHLNLDPIEDETIVAHDLRLRLLVTGAVGELIVKEEGSTIDIHGAVRVRVSVPFARLNDADARIEIRRNADEVIVDIVLLESEPAPIRLTDITCGLGFVINLAPDRSPSLTVPFGRANDGRLELEAGGPSGTLRLSVPLTPGPKTAMWAASQREIRPR